MDYPPFYDANSPNLVEKDIQAYTQRIGQAKQFEKQKKWQDMENVLLEALSYETHPHASGYYLLGTALERQKICTILGSTFIDNENVHYLYMQIFRHEESRSTTHECVVSCTEILLKGI